MSTRISIKELDAAVINLNQTFGYTMGQDGSFCLQGAYGGWQLQRKRGNGIEAVTNGYISKPELYRRIMDIAHGATLVLRNFQITLVSPDETITI